MSYQPRTLFNAESSLYLYIKYIRFGLIGFYSMSTIIGYLILNPLYTYILKTYLVLFGLVRFYRMSAIFGYLMPNTVDVHILSIDDLVWLGFMTYQPL